MSTCIACSPLIQIPTTELEGRSSNPSNQPLHGKEHRIDVILQHNPIEVILYFLDTLQGACLKAYQFDVQIMQLATDLLHSFRAHVASIAQSLSRINSLKVLCTGVPIAQCYSSTYLLSVFASTNFNPAAPAPSLALS